MREREWRVVTLDEDGRVLSNYGERLSEDMARTVHRFACSRDGKAATLQFREPPEQSPPWETVSTECWRCGVYLWKCDCTQRISDAVMSGSKPNLQRVRHGL